MVPAPANCFNVVTSEREARAKSLWGLGKKSEYERPGPARPGHAFYKLISRQPHIRLTSGLFYWKASSLLPRMSPIFTIRISYRGTWQLFCDGLLCEFATCLTPTSSRPRAAAAIVRKTATGGAAVFKVTGVTGCARTGRAARRRGCAIRSQRARSFFAD